MTATAGRVRMPPNNRVPTYRALGTHDIWTSVIGYDPYAPEQGEDDSKKSSNRKFSKLYNNLTLMLRMHDGNKEKKPEAKKGDGVLASGLKKGVESEEEGESESSDDSEVDSEIERIIAERYGKKISNSQGKSSSKKEDSDFSKERKKREIRLKNMTCKKRRSDHSEDRDEGRRKWKKIDDSSDEDEDDDDDRHQRKRKIRNKEEKKKL
ncbi:hypothetical protein CRYUN_Cryun26dG0110500 [Craigia yunnanensis]